MRKKKKELENIHIVAYTIIILVVGAFAGYLAPGYLPFINRAQTKSNLVEINTLAVMPATGLGATMPLRVEARPGSGRVLTDIETMTFWQDTQQSIQIAGRLAEETTGKDLSEVDLIYQIPIESVSVSGDSAGVALTVATIAALTEQKLDPTVVVTGAIDHEGNIKPVGGVSEKAQAAARSDLKILLVPPGQGNLYSVEAVKSCEETDGWEICKVNYEKDYDSLNIEVIEVSTLEEVLPYFGIRLG